MGNMKIKIILIFGILFITNTLLLSQSENILKTKIKLDTTYSLSSDIIVLLSDNDNLYIGDGDGKIYNVNSKKVLSELNIKHNGWINTLDINRTKNILASGSSSGDILFYDINTNETIQKISFSNKCINNLKFVNDSLVLIVVDSVYLLNINNQRVLKKYYNTARITSLNRIENTNTILFGTFGGDILIFDPKTFKVTKKISSQKSKVTSITNFQNRDLAIGYENGTISIISLKGYKPIKLLKGHYDVVSGLAFSPDGKYLVSSGWDKNIFVWNMGNYKLELNINAHRNIVSAITFWKNKLVTASFDNSIKLWNNF